MTETHSPRFVIHGADLQYVELALIPKAAVLAEKKSMMYVENEIVIDTVLGDGLRSGWGVLGRFWRALTRSFTGEALFNNLYTNQGKSIRKVAIAAPGPGAIVPLDLSAMGGEVICQKGAFLCGDLGTQVKLAFQKRLRTGFLGGEGFVMQKISGKGHAFIHACGAHKIVDLPAGQSLRIDAGCLVALSQTVRYDIAYTGSLKTSILGGEGMFYATVNGPGRVWLQSLPMNRLSRNLFASMATGRASGGVWGKLYLVVIIIAVLAGILGGGES
ncbi:MAG: AIM24 family protein [Thiobacillus sp.]